MRQLKMTDGATFWLLLLTAIGFFVLAARLLLFAEYFHSALLYIAVPFALSIGLYVFTPYTNGSTWKKRFWNNLRTCLIVILASSLILMEGYVCVIMALPLFLIVLLFAFLTAYLWNNHGQNSPKSYLLPVVIILSSLEGTAPELTFNRYNEVSYSQVVDMDVATIRQRLQQPIKFKGERHWLLSVFPMPTYVGTVQLKVGDIRQYDFVYHRWFVTNTKIGRLNVHFKEVGETFVRTAITDSSYISGYMNLLGTDFRFEPINERQTKVTLRVSFERLLDPLWYYQPLERFAVRKGAEYFIREVLGADVGGGDHV